MGVGGHDGGGSVRAALRGGSQLFRRRRDAPGKGVDDHGLTDDAGRGGQNILFVNVQRLAHQSAALLCQRHAVGGAGVGVAAVDHNGLCVAIGQMGAVHLDGRTADLVGGVHARSRAAHLGLDERQIIFFAVICPDAAMDTGGGKALGRADAARNFLILHFTSPIVQHTPSSVTFGDSFPRPGEAFYFCRVR